MSKLKAPLLSLGAKGSLGDILTFRESRGVSIAEKKPIPAYRNSLSQQYQRWTYQDYAAWWHSLSAAAKQLWETNARPLKITGFNYWLSTRLTLLSDIKGQWHLDHLFGAITPDSSRNNNPGTLFGPLSTTGIIDHALWFDGVDDYVEVGNQPELDVGTADFSLEAWFKAAVVLPGYATIMNKFQAGGQGYVLYIRPNGKIYFRTEDTTTIDESTPLAYNDDTWHHVIANRSGASCEIFVDGYPVKIGAAKAGNLDTTFPFRIGERSDAHAWQFKGSLDEIVVRNRILTAADALRHAGRSWPL